MADTTTTPEDRVRIFSRDGTPLIEFRAHVERSWAIAEEGRALFNYPSRKTDIVNRTALQFGNWLLVENTHLPPWVGVIDVPREWTGTQVAVHAYTPEHVLSWRIGPAEEKLTGSAGSIFEKLINYANEAEATILRAGNIYRGGVQREETLNPTPLSEDLARLWERSQEDYNWRPVTDALGRLVVYADWFQKLGTDYSALLHAGPGGGNIEAVRDVLVEDGPIYNEVLAYGDGLAWQSRPFAMLSDTDSIGTYGKRQAAQDYTGVTNIETLAENGREFIARNGIPLRTFHLNAINKGDTFKFLQLGNTLPLRLANVGFGRGGLGYETTVRIVGMVYDPGPDRNLVELVTEELL